MPDAVITHLYEWDPAALEKLLDLRRGKFEYILEREGELTLFIARFGQKIQVSSISAM